MADPDDGDLSPEEILRKAEEAFDKGWQLFKARQLPEAIAAFMRSLELNRQVEGTERQQASCLTLIGSILSSTNQYQDSLTILALGLWNNLPGNEDIQADCLLSIGIALGGMGRCEEALTAFQQALDTYRTLPDTEFQQAVCLFDTGTALGRVGRYEEALTAFQQALTLYRTLPGTQRQQAVCLFDTGITLDEVGRYEEALTAYQQALAAYRTLPDTQRQQATCLNNTGNTLYEVGRYEEALTAYQQALAAYRTLPDTQRQQATCLNNTGNTLYEVGRYEEARTPFRRALTPAIISALKSNAARFQFPTEHDRLTWLTEIAEPSLDLALSLASINDQPALASDLIATFRTGGSIDITRLATQNRITDPGQSILSLTTSFEDSTPPTAPTPTGLALTASPPLGTDATPSANLPRRPGPVLHMPYQRTALADYRSDDDTTRPHAHYR